MTALAAYRCLLRSTRIAFRGILYSLSAFKHLTSIGDYALLSSARVQAREEFDKNRYLEDSSKEATEAVKHAESVALVLRHNIVQGEQQKGKDVLSMAECGIFQTNG